MFEGFHPSSNVETRGRCSWAVVAVVLALLAAGCGTVAVSVEQPVGAYVELYEKGKWFGCCGPDWGTGWSKVCAGTIELGEPQELEFEAVNSWLESTLTCFPRQYRARFDLSRMTTYPETPSSMVEIRYVREIVPPKYQDVIRLWHQGRTLDVLTHLPPDVLADVLYNLGDKFRRLLKEEVSLDVQAQAAQGLKALLEAGEAPTPKEVESWLKSFLTKEQLDQVCKWVRGGVMLKNVKWVRLGGEPKHEDVPAFWRLIKGFVDLFIRQPEIRSTHVDFLNDVILRDLMVTKIETKLVNVATLKFYAEVRTFDTTYYSDRVVPAVDLVEDIGLAEIVRPTPEQEAELQQFGMTRGVRLDREARAETIRRGLPPAGLQSTLVTSVRSQVIGALLEGQMAYIIIWNNPRRRDPVRFLTTVVTTTPYGIARVWALRGNKELCQASAVFDKNDAPIGRLASWVIGVLDQRSLFVQLDDPLAVIALGRRRLAPWKDMPREPVSFVKPMKELEVGGPKTE